MSNIPTSIIRTYAESIGVTNLSEDYLAALAQDTEYRVREVIQEASKFMIHGKRTKLSVEDVNYALEARNVERLYGYDPAESLTFKMVPNTNIYYVPKEEVDLEAFIQQPLPKAPQPLTLTSHWLAIDGIQPMIPENPNLQEPSGAIEKEGAAIPRKDLQEETEVKPLVKHVISKELQAYYDTVIADLTSPEPDRIKAALYSVATDSGLQQLLPYFIQFVAEMVPKHLRSLPQLQIYLGLISSLLANEHIFVEPYLHQIMPPVLSCLLGKRLCEDPEKEDHWSLRDRCAHITSDLCRKFGNTYTTLVPRVTKTMLKTLLDPQKPITSHYGAIVGLSAIGPHAIETLLIPHISTYMEALSASSEMTDEEKATPAEISKCRMALKTAASRWLNDAYSPEFPEHVTKKDLLSQLFDL